MLLLLGTVIVLGSVAGGYVLHGGHLLVLNQPSEFLVIGGAAIGSLLISTPPAVIKRLIRHLGRFFKGPAGRQDYLDLLAMQYQLYRLAQQSGVMALEGHRDDPAGSSVFSKYPRFLVRDTAVRFLTDSVKVIILGGVSAHDLEALMDEDLEVHEQDELRPASTLGRISDSLPGLGIVAAVLGVVITMQAIDGPPSEIGHKVAAALVGTFLGILLCYGLVGPMATHLEHRVEEETRYLVCIKAGLLALYKGCAPAIAVEFARRTIPGEVRPAFDETEEYCRATRAEATAEAA